MERGNQMIFNNPHLLTRLDIWSPRYKDKHGELKQPVVLMAQYKVNQASPWIIIEFTKAKHLMGQRYCIKQSEVQICPLDSNTKIPCYAVPMSKLERWDSSSEVKQLITSFGW